MTMFNEGLQGGDVAVRGKEIQPKGSWRDLENHYLSAIEDPWYKVILELQHQISWFTMQFYEEKQLKTMHLPVTTGSISSPMGLGSDSLPVKVNIANVDTYLADSMQFMLEYGCRLYDKGVFYLMPSFRGEDADQRHLCQFYHSEAEIPGGLDDVIKLSEDYVKFLCQKLLEKNREMLFRVNSDLSHIEQVANHIGPFPRLTLDEALVKLQAFENGDEFIEVHPEGFSTINSKGEKKLIEMYGGIVWLTHFDSRSVPFYQAYHPENKERAQNADLLFGIGEVIGSGERHETEAQVLEALEQHQVSREEYEWYCTMKERYPLKTAGFGMGVERFILWLLNHDDIRDCQIVPRFNGVNVLP